MLYKDIKYKLVDTAGQVTAVVIDEVKRNKQSVISNYLMNQNSQIEQVVFLEKNRIQTMGSELCINGSLAGAFLLKNSVLEISGIDKPIKFSKDTQSISAKFPLNLIASKKDNVILLQGIVYLISNDKVRINKLFLRNLANKYKVPASGIIRFNTNKIIPIVYVRDTDSLVYENACGSGSLAYFIYSGISKIKQPSARFVEIKKTKKYFTIKSDVKIL